MNPLVVLETPLVVFKICWSCQWSWVWCFCPDKNRFNWCLVPLIMFISKVFKSEGGQLIEIFWRPKSWFSHLVSKSVLWLYFCSDLVPLIPTAVTYPKTWPVTDQLDPSVVLHTLLEGVPKDLSSSDALTDERTKCMKSGASVPMALLVNFALQRD